MSESHCTQGIPYVSPFQLSKHEQHAFCPWPPDQDTDTQERLALCSRLNEQSEAGARAMPLSFLCFPFLLLPLSLSVSLRFSPEIF